MQVTNLDVAVVGASLGGLSAANVLNNLGANVEVFECFPHGFHERGGALGNVDVDLLEEIRGADSIRKPIRGHGHFYGDLWQYLYEGLPEGMVKFGVEVEEVIQTTTTRPQLKYGDVVKEFDLIVGADGGRSIIRQYVTKEMPKYAGYTVWRGLVPQNVVQGPPSGSAIHHGTYYETLGFPCSGIDGKGLWNCGVYMAMPESEIQKNTSKNRQVETSMKKVPDWFVPFTRTMFGSTNARFWSECVNKGKVTPHPIYELAADQAVKGRIILLGDAAHMASPRTGAGAYTAMQDAITLRRSLEQGSSIEKALSYYNEKTVRRGNQLYQRSRMAARTFLPRDGSQPHSPACLVTRID